MMIVRLSGHPLVRNSLSEPIWRITVFMLCIEHMSSVFSRMRLVLGVEGKLGDTDM